MKSLVLFFVFIISLYSADNIYEGLIGKNESELNQRTFICKNNVCSGSEFRYFNNPLLDEVIEQIETHSNEKKEIYRVILHLSNIDKFNNNKDIIEGIFQAVKMNISNKYSCYMENKSDKYGNRMMIIIEEPRKRHNYVIYIKKQYQNAIKHFKMK